VPYRTEMVTRKFLVHNHLIFFFSGYMFLKFNQKGRCGWYGRGWGQGGEMTQALYAHMNKIIKKNKT
jgi:hypothetical protein